jgi:hypothetical protein
MKGSFMRWTTGVSLTLVTVVALGCSSSSPTAAPVKADASTAALWSRITVLTSARSSGATSAAVIDGFRVHPDPGDDGVIHAVEGENVVVNATDIATRPPGPQSFLVVNWGDGPNQRVGCGPCRMDHPYAPGRYTLIASLDGAPGDRSISVPVEISPQREKRVSLFPSFGFIPSSLTLGSTGYLVLPFPLPEGVTVYGLDLSCSPPDVLVPDFMSPPQSFPDGIGLPFLANEVGTCGFSLSGTGPEGPFTATSTLTVTQ